MNPHDTTVFMRLQTQCWTSPSNDGPIIWPVRAGNHAPEEATDVARDTDLEQPGEVHITRLLILLIF